jgi:hypothetical protein
MVNRGVSEMADIGLIQRLMKGVQGRVESIRVRDRLLVLLTGVLTGVGTATVAGMTVREAKDALRKVGGTPYARGVAKVLVQYTGARKLGEGDILFPSQKKDEWVGERAIGRVQAWRVVKATLVAVYGPVVGAVTTLRKIVAEGGARVAVAVVAPVKAQKPNVTPMKAPVVIPTFTFGDEGEPEAKWAKWVRKVRKLFKLGDWDGEVVDPIVGYVWNELIGRWGEGRISGALFDRGIEWPPPYGALDYSGMD